MSESDLLEKNSINSQFNIKNLVNHFNSLSQPSEIEYLNKYEHRKCEYNIKNSKTSYLNFNASQMENKYHINELNYNSIIVDVQEKNVDESTKFNLEVKKVPDRPKFLNLPVLKICSVNDDIEKKKDLKPLFAKRPQSLNIGNFYNKVENSIDSSDSNNTPLCSEVFQIQFHDVNLDSQIYDNEIAKIPKSQNIDISLLELGRVAPIWMPDACTSRCLQCRVRFTFTKRRHHCRTCGKIFCSSCCRIRVRLFYLDLREARVCNICLQDLIEAQKYITNEMVVKKEEINHIVTHQSQNIKLSMPILKKIGYTRNVSKRVKFVDDVDSHSLTKSIKDCKSIEKDGNIIFPVDSIISIKASQIILDGSACKKCWIYTTENLIFANNFELILIHEANSQKLNTSVVQFMTTLVNNILDGKKFGNMCYVPVEADNFFVDNQISGFLLVSSTFANLKNIFVYSGSPLIFLLHVHEYECFVARYMPLQFLLRLGYLYQCFPYPICNDFTRNSIFSKISKNYIYNSISNRQHIPDLSISIFKFKIYITILKGRQNMVLDLINSSENYFLISTDLNLIADSHFVCIEEDGRNKTKIIRISENNSVISASFILFVIGRECKCCTMDDGLLVYLTGPVWLEMKQQLSATHDFQILLRDYSNEICPIIFQWGEVYFSQLCLFKSLRDNSIKISLRNWQQQGIPIFVHQNLNMKYTQSFLSASHEFKIISMNDKDFEDIIAIEKYVILNIGEQIIKNIGSLDIKQISTTISFTSDGIFKFNLCVPASEKEENNAFVSNLLSLATNILNDPIIANNDIKQILILENLLIETYFLCF